MTTNPPIFDCDNHYYEARDAFTRHVPKPMRARCVEWAEIDGRHPAIGAIEDRRFCHCNKVCIRSKAKSREEVHELGLPRGQRQRGPGLDSERWDLYFSEE